MFFIFVLEGFHVFRKEAESKQQLLEEKKRKTTNTK